MIQTRNAMNRKNSFDGVSKRKNPFLLFVFFDGFISSPLRKPLRPRARKIPARLRSRDLVQVGDVGRRSTLMGFDRPHLRSCETLQEPCPRNGSDPFTGKPLDMGT